MVHYPIRTLIEAGITDILIVTGDNSAGDFLKLLRNGAEFGLNRLNYAYQEGEGGIAAALGLAEHFADGGPICVVLGDNILEKSIGPSSGSFGVGLRAKDPAEPVPDPQRFGVGLRNDKVTG
jgi:glucose-1-phosphate thymidylyltransferase